MYLLKAWTSTRDSTCGVCSSNNCEKSASITDQEEEGVFDSEGDSDFVIINVKTYF